MDERIAQFLMGLALHYPKPTRSSEEQARWLSDYLADLEGYPFHAIQAACTDWRRSPAKAFPKSGEILSMVRREATRERGSSVGPDRPLSDAEYQGADLSDKVRHHMLLKNEAECKAGAMWIGKTDDHPGRPAHPHELPERWHKWRAVAASHAADAARYRKLMNDAHDVNKNA